MRRVSSPRVAILQPGYLPWLGYFDQMAAVDLFLSLDDVAYTKQDWRNRNRIRTPTPEGWSWLTVPVDARTSRGLIQDVRVRPPREWWPKQLRLLDEHYRRAPHYGRVRAALLEAFAEEHELLADLDLALADRLASLFGIETPVVRTSTLTAEVERAGGFESGDKSGRLLRLCQAVGASLLYDGKAAAEFLDLDRFAAAGIEVVFQEYEHPTYPQMVEGFVSHLSAVDYLACCDELPRWTTLAADSTDHQR